jgi:hypothetical protein
MASEVLPDRRQAGSLSYNALRSVEARSQGHAAEEHNEHHCEMKAKIKMLKRPIILGLAGGSALCNVKLRGRAASSAAAHQMHQSVNASPAK